MRPFRLVIALLFCAATAGAQEVSTLIVPVVGSTFGSGMVRWMTDVELRNETALEVDVAVELPSVPESPAFLLTLAPGQSQRFTDIVGQAFGMDAALSSLRVTTGSRRSVTVRAHAYAVHEGRVSPLQPIDVYSTDTYFPIRVLDGLAFSDAQRTNIGLVNFSEQEATFVLSLQRVAGRNLATAQIRVGAGALVHTSLQSLFPVVSKGTGFSVMVETPWRETHVYASVIENDTNGARFIVPRLGSR